METNLPCAPGVPARFLYDDGVGVQVWEIDAPSEQHAVLIVSDGAPVVLLSRLVVGTAGEAPAVEWAVRHVARGDPSGVYVRLG